MKNKLLILGLLSVTLSTTTLAEVTPYIGAAGGVVSNEDSKYSQISGVKGGFTYNDVVGLEASTSGGTNDSRVTTFDVKYNIPLNTSVSTYMTIGYADTQTYQLDEKGLSWGLGLQLQVGVDKSTDVSIDVGYKALTGFMQPDSGMFNVGVNFKL